MRCFLIAPLYFELGAIAPVRLSCVRLPENHGCRRVSLWLDRQLVF
jgi:hypothetical protein